MDRVGYQEVNRQPYINIAVWTIAVIEPLSEAIHGHQP